MLYKILLACILIFSKNTFAGDKAISDSDSSNDVQPASQTIISDFGLAQSFRQQLSSDCYGFVNHDEGVRGYGVDGAFQLLRDGYPWARFENTANLMIEREEVLVGGAGQACSFVPPGGLVNLVTRRAQSEAQPDGHTLVLVDQFGSNTIRSEQPVINSENVQLRMSVRKERYRNAAKNIEDVTDFASHADFLLSANTKLRWDIEYRDADFNHGLGEPAFENQPTKINRFISREQPWARYQFKSLGNLLALEHQINPHTLLKFSYSAVDYKTDYHDLFLEPQIGGQPQLIDFVYPYQRFKFNAFYAAAEHQLNFKEIQHFIKLNATRIEVTTPDQDRPVQLVGAYSPGLILPKVETIAASAGRALTSQENRFTIQDHIKWGELKASFGLQQIKFTDDNETVKQQKNATLPIVSLAYQLTPHWLVQANKSRGATGRQYASITSNQPNNIAGIGLSDEVELGIKYHDDALNIGLGVFKTSKPYQFQRQNITVWRGEQAHQGLETTFSWAHSSGLFNVAFTAQLLKAKVTDTGDPTLDGKQPTGVSNKRAALFAEYHFKQDSPWTLSVAGNAFSKRATFDDNAVFVSGYSTWSAGLEWQGSDQYRGISSQLSINNLFNTYAWDFVSGGYAFALAPRTLEWNVRFSH